MTDARSERMSDYRMREKSTEQKSGETADNLELLFRREDGLSVTKSSNGNDRVRAHIPDEDGYAGWVENAYYGGVAKLCHDGRMKYIAEQHFPHKSSKPTFLWEFTPDTGELSVIRQDGTGDTPQLDMPIEADDSYRGYFLRFTSDLTTAYRFNDYEGDTFTSQRYTFQLDDLQ